MLELHLEHAALEVADARRRSGAPTTGAHGPGHAAVVVHQPQPRPGGGRARRADHRAARPVDARGARRLRRARRPPTAPVYHLEGVPLVNFLAAPFYLFDAMDTLDKIDRDHLVPHHPGRRPHRGLDRGRLGRRHAGGHRDRLTVMEWIYFIHTPREDFAATMTPDERAVWDTHFERLQRLTRRGRDDPGRADARARQHGHRRVRGARRGGCPADHGGGPGHRQRHRHGRAAPVHGGAAAAADDRPCDAATGACAACGGCAWSSSTCTSAWR